MAGKIETSSGKASAGMLAILFDGSCEMCRTGAERFERFDNSGTIEPLNLNDPAARAKFPDLELEDLIDLLETSGTSVRTVQAGLVDLTTASGRMSARIIGAVARPESDTWSWVYQSPAA